MSSGAPASGQGDNLNKVLTTRAGNDWRMVNVPQVGNFDATFALCQP
jgi:hypothetical protein